MKTLYETLLEALNKADEGFFIAEGERILYANDACSRISGYGSAELLALSSPYELVVPEDRGLVFGGWPPDAQRMVKSHETAIIHKSGRRVDVEVAVKPLRGDGVRSVMILRDITERKRAEKKGRFQAHLLEAVGQALIATDLRGRITYWNRCAETLYGWSADETVGRLAGEILVSAEQQAQAAEIMAELRAGKSWSGEFTVRHRDGTLFPVMVTDTPVQDDQGTCWASSASPWISQSAGGRRSCCGSSRRP